MKLALIIFNEVGACKGLQSLKKKRKKKRRQSKQPLGVLPAGTVVCYMSLLSWQGDNWTSDLLTAYERQAVEVGNVIKGTGLNLAKNRK